MKKMKVLFLFVKSWILSFFSEKERCAYIAHKQASSQRMQELVHIEKKRYSLPEFKRRMDELYAIRHLGE